MDVLMDWLKNNSAEIQSIVAISMLFVTGIYAFVNYEMRKEMKMVREREIRPIMSLVNAEIQNEEGRGYPLYLYFENSGQGTAYIAAIDCDNTNISIHVGTPTNVPVKAKTDIKIWLPCANEKVDLKLSYYYYDYEERCYCTELQVICEYTNDPKQLYFVDYQFPRRKITMDNEMPSCVKNWEKDKCTLFSDEWWT